MSYDVISEHYLNKGISRFITEQTNLIAYWLWKCPTSSDVDDGLDDALAIVVYETEWAAFVCDGQRELIVVNETNLFDLRRVVHVVQDHLVAEHAQFVCGRHLDRVQAHLWKRNYTWLWNELGMFQDPVSVPDLGKKGGSGSGRIREKTVTGLNKTYLVIIFAISQKSSNIWNNF